jgi:hypothetical protein
MRQKKIVSGKLIPRATKLKKRRQLKLHGAPREKQLRLHAAMQNPEQTLSLISFGTESFPKK